MATSLDRLYYQDYLLTSITTTITDVNHDELGSYIMTSETIFHPKGGGQPQDEGTITIMGKKYPVVHLKVDEKGAVMHYLEEKLVTKLPKGTIITMEVDRKKRVLYARYHTAAHLIDSALLPLYPDLLPHKGNHIPGQAAVFYTLKGKEKESLQKEDFASYDLNKMADYLEKTLPTFIQQKIPIHTNYKDKLRSVQIGNFPLSHCGGTHVHHTGTLDAIIIKKIKFKKKEGLKVAYEMH